MSRTLKNTSKPKIDTKSSVEDNFNIDLYVDKDEKDKKPAETKKKSFFEILATDSKPMINFSTCKLEENQTSCELTSITESVRKKRKIKMLPVERNEYLSGPSTLSDANIENVNAPTNSQQSNVETDNNSTDKKVLGKTYVKEVSNL